jgi:hypothetical protein
VLPLYWWLTTSTSPSGSPPATVVVAPEEATVVVAEEAAVVVAEEAVVMAEAAVVAPKRGLRRDEGRRGGDVGRAYDRGDMCRCGVRRWGGTEQHRAGDGACAHCASC